MLIVQVLNTLLSLPLGHSGRHYPGPPAGSETVQGHPHLQNWEEARVRETMSPIN